MLFAVSLGSAGGERVGTSTAAGVQAPDVAPVNLTHHPAEDRSPVWAPDGLRLLFESNRGGNRDLYVMRTDGTDVRRLTMHEADDVLPTWAPDGDRMIFQSTRDGTAGLFARDLEGGPAELVVADPSAEMSPDWSPDGRRVLYTSQRAGSIDIWVIELGGGQPERLTSNPFRDVWPRWSPDGLSLVFFSRRDTDGDSDELYVMDWSSRVVTRLTHHPTHHDFVPAWAPDGRFIVAAISGSDGGRALVIFDRLGEQRHRFAEGYHRVSHPTWSPDGRSIAYAARVADGVNADIFVVEVPEL